MKFKTINALVLDKKIKLVVELQTAYTIMYLRMLFLSFGRSRRKTKFLNRKNPHTVLAKVPIWALKPSFFRPQ